MIEHMTDGFKNYIAAHYAGFAEALPAAPKIDTPGLIDICFDTPDSIQIGESNIKIFIEFEDFITVETGDINGDLNIDLPLTIYILFNTEETANNLNLLLMRHAELFTKMIGADPTLDNTVIDSNIERLKLYRSVEGNENIKGLEFKITLNDEILF